MKCMKLYNETYSHIEFKRGFTKAGNYCESE